MAGGYAPLESKVSFLPFLISLGILIEVLLKGGWRE